MVRLVLPLAWLLVLIACNPVGSEGDGDGDDGDGDSMSADAAPQPDGGGCGACGDNASCVDGACKCDTGYTGDGLVCTDFNECEELGGACDPDARCDNSEGSFTCTCNDGFVGPGTECKEIWKLAQTVPGTVLDNGAGAVVAGLGDRIFFGQEGAQVGSSYFKSIDVVTGAVGNHPVPPGDELCACGFGNVLVAMGSSLYSFGNGGAVFAGGAWAPANYPSLNRRGEAGGAASSNRVYLIGGRDEATNQDTATVQFYTGGASGTWTTAGSYPWSTSQTGGYTLAGTSRLYVFGGYASDNSRRHAASLDTAQPGAPWVVLPDLPEDAPNGPTGGEHGGKLLVCNGQTLQIYDPASNTWVGTLPMPREGNHWRLAMAAGTAHAIGDAAGSVVVYALDAIE